MFQNFSPQEKLYFLDFILFTFIFLILIWNIFLQWSLSRLKKTQKVFLTGKNEVDLENFILEQKKELDTQKKNLTHLASAHSKTKNLAFSGIHQVGMLRFNPFRDIGGDQSFSLALLNGQKDGVVISSLYSREGVRIYAKTVKNGTAVKYPLTKEEETAIEIAGKK